MSEMPITQQTPRVDNRESREEEPPVDDAVRCPGCATSRQWRQYDMPPADVNAVGTCPDCGTHILGFDMITEDEVKELSEFLLASSPSPSGSSPTMDEDEGVRP
jgi:hypothetical protein